MTRILDRRFRHVGRIKRSSGTDHLPTFRRINEMLSGLYERGRLDVLRSIQAGTYTPLEVWEAYRVNELERLPTIATIAPVETTIRAWVEKYDCSPAHRLSLSQSLRHIVKVGRATSTVADLPAMLSDLREAMRGKHPRTFNLARAAAQAFVRDTMRRTHPLWAEITDIAPLRVTAQRVKHPLTPSELDALEIPDDAGDMAHSMARTGMGPGEYWGKWKVLSDRIHVYGTKRAGRDRDIPLCGTITAPKMTYKEFREALVEAEAGITPYDLRRSYANWMEQAGIPRTRRRLYLGHGASDVTDLYEWHEVEKFLAEDAERLRKYVFGAPTENDTALRVVK